MTAVWMVVCVLAVMVGACAAVIERLRRNVYDEAGWVYFMGARGQPDSPLKIGRTARDPRERMDEIQTMSPYPLEVVHAFYCANAVFAEAALHDELSEYRLHGEWFDRDAAAAVLSMITNGRK